MRGVVKKYLDQKGYGYLKVPGEHDVFFHVTGFMIETDQDAIRQGDEVEFEMGERNGKPLAVRIRIIDQELERAWLAIQVSMDKEEEREP